VITGEEDQRPEVQILLDLLDELEVGAATLQRWARTGDPSPVQRLLQREFAGVEDALAELAERGFVIRRGPGDAPPATSR
jgi:hypothetical protein